MKTVNLIFPHHLFENSPLFQENTTFYLIEEYLYFKQYKFHKQKIAFHRTSMKRYEAFLLKKGFDVVYINAFDEIADIRTLLPYLVSSGVQQINYIDPVDNWLQKRIAKSVQATGLSTTVFDSPLFINSKATLGDFFRKDKKKYHQTTFYVEQRKNLGILLDNEGKPEGGKWTYDTENRKKYPVKKTPPSIQFPDTNAHYEEAKSYVKTYFDSNLGILSDQPLYPSSFEETREWLQQFFVNRFKEFGIYEDAIVPENSILNHSVLSPMLNIGLIGPKEVIKNALAFAKEMDIPLNSTEGFVRQIMGWREFIRGIYESRGTEERTRNFWEFKRKIPTSFYDGTTGIPPLDTTIKKVLQTGYCNHIERLMILGNFMMLCEFDPKEVYQWFMELFVDAYDWVMVTNIYGMSQFSDGGLMATKPYISGSNYLMKMSNYKKGEWQATWDGLFWRFMDVHRNFFLSNPRLGMLVRMYDKMSPEKRETHLIHADKYLKKIDALLSN